MTHMGILSSTNKKHHGYDFSIYSNAIPIDIILLLWMLLLFITTSSVINNQLLTCQP